jgi:hypothetical protein
MSPRAWLLAAGIAMAMPVAAQDGDAARQALRADAWSSSDAEGNEARKLALGWDVAHRDLQHWWGVKVERARYSGDGWSDTSDRIYLAGAGERGGWLWEGDLGTDGDDLIGRASIHSQDARRKELFIERDVLETRGGIEHGWVQTFAGAAIDLPMGERWSATVLGGMQDFGTGSNLRTHLRGNLVHVVAPEQGISLQLRTRYFNDSDPREADYYSPPWYGEALGVVGWRRNIGGYQWRALAGSGRQRSAGEDWKRARMLQVGLETPRWKDAWLRIDAGYTDTPVLTDSGEGSYSYRYLRVQGVVAF